MKKFSQIPDFFLWVFSRSVNSVYGVKEVLKVVKAVVKQQQVQKRSLAERKKEPELKKQLKDDAKKKKK